MSFYVYTYKNKQKVLINKFIIKIIKVYFNNNCFLSYFKMERRTSNRPIDYLKDSIDQIILIKVKRNRLFRGMLRGFDEHLNLFLEETSQIFEYQDEEGNIREEHENLGSIVVRGDNVIFCCLSSPM